MYFPCCCSLSCCLMISLLSLWQFFTSVMQCCCLRVASCSFSKAHTWLLLLKAIIWLSISHCWRCFSSRGHHFPPLRFRHARMSGTFNLAQFWWHHWCYVLAHGLWLICGLFSDYCLTFSMLPWLICIVFLSHGFIYSWPFMLAELMPFCASFSASASCFRGHWQWFLWRLSFASHHVIKRL